MTNEQRAELDAALRNIDAEIHLEGYCSEHLTGDDFSTWERGIIIDAVAATVAGLAADAARYRWLRDASVPPHNFYISTPDEFAGTRYKPQDVDDYIDAARAALAGAA